MVLRQSKGHLCGLLGDFFKCCIIWGFPKNYGYLFGGPIKKDYSILGSILGSPHFGKLPLVQSEENIRHVLFCYRAQVKCRSGSRYISTYRDIPGYQYQQARVVAG